MGYTKNINKKYYEINILTIEYYIIESTKSNIFRWFLKYI